MGPKSTRAANISTHFLTSDLERERGPEKTDPVGEEEDVDVCSSCCFLFQALQDEGEDGGAQARILSELLQVAAVFAFGPHSHLEEGHEGEESHRHTLGHHCEANPGAQLGARRRAHTDTHTRTHTLHLYLRYM